jgi:small subunit ribosomal protein S20
MPHTHSAEKRLRQTERRRTRNRARLKVIKKDLRAFDDAAKSGNAADLQKAYNVAVGHLDKAAAKRTIHPNKAARKKSQLAKQLHAMKAKG